MTGVEPLSIAIAILAAGASTRLGRPKQLVSWRGTSLLRRAAATAIDSALGPVLVILGADADRCAKDLMGLDVRIIRHAGWHEGMGSSIRAAAEQVTNDAAIGALLIMTCDQPCVGPNELRQLDAAYRQGGVSMVGSAYAGTVGIPALFDRSQFPALASLCGDRGARALLQSAGPSLRSVSCPAAAFDVDSELEAVRGSDADPQQAERDQAAT